MGGQILEVIEASDGSTRAVIRQRQDGMFQVELERLVRGDGEFEPNVYWSPLSKRVSLTDSLERAIVISLDAVGTAQE